MSSARAISREPALTHRDGTSWLHTRSPLAKLAAVLLLSAAAATFRSPLALAALAALVAGGYRVAGLPARDLWRDARWLLVQGAIVVALFGLRDGAGGLATGARIGVQLLLFFLPGALLLRTTPLGALVHALERVLPRPAAFVVGTSLRFVPFFTRELGEIAAAQRLRGVPLRGRALLDPRRLGILGRCLVIPLLVRAVRVAGEAALSAEARGIRIGAHAGPAGIRVIRAGQPLEEVS